MNLRRSLQRLVLTHEFANVGKIGAVLTLKLRNSS
jgi:hypothetical protein